MANSIGLKRRSLASVYGFFCRCHGCISEYEHPPVFLESQRFNPSVSPSRSAARAQSKNPLTGISPRRLWPRDAVQFSVACAHPGRRRAGQRRGDRESSQ